MPKPKTAKKTTQKLCAICITPKAYKVLTSFKKRANCASESDALLLLHSFSNKVGPNLAEASMQTPCQWFSKERCQIPGCDPLKKVRISATTLLTEAVKLTRHANVDAFVIAAALEFAQKVFVERARASAGQRNARGSAARDIERAIAILSKKGAGEITAGNIRRLTRGNLKTIKKYLATLSGTNTTNIAL